MHALTPVESGVDAPHQCPLGVGSKLPLPLYADVRLHIPMTHNDDSRTGLYPSDAGKESTFSYLHFTEDISKDWKERHGKRDRGGWGGGQGDRLLQPRMYIYEPPSPAHASGKRWYKIVRNRADEKRKRSNMSSSRGREREDVEVWDIEESDQNALLTILVFFKFWWDPLFVDTGKGAKGAHDIISTERYVSLLFYVTLMTHSLRCFLVLT